MSTAKNTQLLQRFGREGTIQIEFPAPKANLYLKISSTDASVAEKLMLSLNISVVMMMMMVMMVMVVVVVVVDDSHTHTR